MAASIEVILIFFSNPDNFLMSVDFDQICIKMCGLFRTFISGIFIMLRFPLSKYLELRLDSDVCSKVLNVQLLNF